MGCCVSDDDECICFENATRYIVCIHIVFMRFILLIEKK